MTVLRTQLPWHYVEEQASKRIEDLRTRLETAPCDKIATIQGEIAGIRYVLNLPINLPHDGNMVGAPPED